MDQKKLFTLSLKFNRYNTQFDYDQTSGFIVIGKTKNVKKKILLVVVLISIGIPIALLLLLFGSKLLFYFLIAPIIYGVIELNKQIKVAKKNKFRKIITPHSFQVESSEGMKEHKTENIENLEIEVTKEAESLAGEASMFFKLKNNEQVQVLSLKGEKTSDIRLDLEYLQSFLEDFMGLQPGPTTSKTLAK